MLDDVLLWVTILFILLIGGLTLGGVLIVVALFIGYFVWWLIALQWGQTPGKQLLGIRSMRANGTFTDLGLTFVREGVVKNLIFGIILNLLTGGIVWALDYLWALWDKDRQTPHDKVSSTVVVDDKTYIRASLASRQGKSYPFWDAEVMRRFQESHVQNTSVPH